MRLRIHRRRVLSQDELFLGGHPGTDTWLLNVFLREREALIIPLNTTVLLMQCSASDMTGRFGCPLMGVLLSCVTLELMLNSSIGRPQQLHSTVQIAQ